MGVAAMIRRRRGADARYRTTLYLLLAPFLLGVVVLVMLPMALSIGLAFTSYDGLSAPEWRGLANFRELAADPLFHIALRNSLVFVALTVPLRVLIALGLALLLNRSRRGVGLYRVAVYVPTIVPGVAYALIWLWIFNPRYGPLNLALESLGLPAPAWLIDSSTALPAIALTAIFYWSFRRLPVGMFEAARLEGMGPLRIWAWIAMPLARPAVAAVALLTFVQYWSDFMNPLLYLRSDDRYTLALGLRVLQQLDATNWPLLMAGAVVMMLPVLLLLVLMQRAFWAAADGERAGASLGRLGA